MVDAPLLWIFVTLFPGAVAGSGKSHEEQGLMLGELFSSWQLPHKRLDEQARSREYILSCESSVGREAELGEQS